MYRKQATSHRSLVKVAWHAPLAVALAALLLARHTAVGDLPASTFQAAGIGILLLFWMFATFAHGLRAESSFWFALALSALLGCVFAFFGDFEGAPNLANSIAVLMSFPASITIGKRLDGEYLATAIVVTTVAVLAAGAALAPEWTVTYLGDTREARTTLGFVKPTFLAEAGLLILFAAGMRRAHWLNGIAAATALATMYVSGSRTALGVAAVFFVYIVYATGRVRTRAAIRVATALGTPIAAMAFAFIDIDQKGLNVLTSNRVAIWAAEIQSNLRGLQWWFGNFSPTEVFAYATERTGLVYHLDGFYVERLIVTGCFGLALFIASLWAFLRRLDGAGRAVVIACMVYAATENSAFNVTSAFAFFPLLLATSIRARPNTGQLAPK